MYTTRVNARWTADQILQNEVLFGEQAIVQALTFGTGLLANNSSTDNGGLFLRQFAEKAKHAAGQEERLRNRAKAELVSAPQKVDSRGHFRQSHIELKYIGSGANGFVFLALAHEDIDAAWRQYQTHGSHGKLCEDLRSAFVVAKFARAVQGYRGEEDLKNEIEFLRFEGLKQSDVGRSMISNMIESHCDGNNRWLTLPFVAGGTLESFVRTCWREMSISLQWHIGVQLAKALVFIHFGATDDGLTPRQGWPLQSFVDLHSGNIMLQPRPDGRYPQVVLVDFGRAQRWRNLTKKIGEGAFRSSRGLDFFGLGHILEGMLVSSKVGKTSKSCKHCNCQCAFACSCPLVDCDECLRVAERYDLIPPLTRSETLLKEYALELKGMARIESDEATLAFLRGFVGTARQEVAEDTYPLTDHMRSHLTQDVITDAELLDTMQCLANAAGHSF